MSHTWRSWCKVLFFEVYTFRGVSSPSNAVSSLNWLNSYIKEKVIELAIKLNQEHVESLIFLFPNIKCTRINEQLKMKWIVEFFTIAKSERRNHLLKGNIILLFACSICPSVSRPKALKQVSVICYIQFHWKVTELFQNRIKKIWSDHKKIALGENILVQIKNLQKCFCCLNVRLATVQIWGQINKFPLTCTFQKEPKRWFRCSHLEVLKNSTIHFILKCFERNCVMASSMSYILM